MVRAEIPGFYYDESKRKYFKIQPNHLATGSAHSRESIQTRARISKIQEDASSRERKWFQGKVNRPASQSLSRLRTRLDTSPSHNADFVTNFYASSLCCQELHAKPQISFVSLAFSSEEKIFVSYARPLGVAPVLPVASESARRHSNLAAYYAILNAEYHHDPVRLRSYPSCVPGHPRILATARAGFWGCGQVSDRSLSLDKQLACDDGALCHNANPRPDVFGFTSTGPIDCWVNDGQQVDVWDISSAPFLENGADAPRFGLASSAGLHVVDVLGSRSNIRPATPLLTSKEQMTLTFRDRNVIMSGQRDGIVNLSDCRVPKSGIARLRHAGGAVTGLVSTKNESIIIVGGFDETSTYDLRFVQAPRAKASSNRKRKNRHVSNECAAPLYRFRVPQERTSDHYAPGKRLDYSAELDLCVIASGRTNLGPDHRNHVTLYQASTGRMLNSNINRYDHSAGGDVIGMGIKKLRDGPESIVVLQEKMIQEWNTIDANNGQNGKSTYCNETE